MTQVPFFVLIRQEATHGDLCHVGLFSTLERAKAEAQHWHKLVERDGTLAWGKSRTTNGIEAECEGLIYDISPQLVDQVEASFDLTVPI